MCRVFVCPAALVVFGSGFWAGFGFWAASGGRAMRLYITHDWTASVASVAAIGLCLDRFIAALLSFNLERLAASGGYHIRWPCFLVVLWPILAACGGLCWILGAGWWYCCGWLCSALGVIWPASALVLQCCRPVYLLAVWPCVAYTHVRSAYPLGYIRAHGQPHLNLLNTRKNKKIKKRGMV